MFTGTFALALAACGGNASFSAGTPTASVVTALAGSGASGRADGQGAVASQVDMLKAERDETVSWLRNLNLEVPSSDANFVMFGPFEDRHEIWNALLRNGVLIREAGPEGYLRVSVGTGGEMTAFRQALLSAMHENRQQ
jgi:histidinol-phosphate aminotransferase